MATDWTFKRRGFYWRSNRPRCIQRFTCRHCGRHFSQQTFSTTYWLKRPELLVPIFDHVVAGCGNRQTARTLVCSHSTVALQIARLARHCLLFQQRELERCRTRDITVDGFESFEWSQYFPFHHNVAVDSHTGYLIYHTDSPLRRKGRMTSQQKRRRLALEEIHGRPSPKAVETGMRTLLSAVLSRNPGATVRSDDHPAYRRALARIHSYSEHQITSSRERRDRHNPLWEVNRLDLMIRHSTAAHRRETIAFAKRRQASAEKLTVFQVWYNYIKRRWLKGRRESAAMVMGLADNMMITSDILRRRLFPSQTTLSSVWNLYYWRAVETVTIPNCRRHVLTYAI